MSNTIEYKGYIAVLSFDFEDNCIYGDVIGTNDKLFFDAETPAEARANFELTINEYISLCEKEGKRPDKPYNGVFQVRVAPDIHKSLAQKAYRENTSINALMSIAAERIVNDVGVEIHHVHSHNHIHTLKIEDTQVSVSATQNWSMTYASTSKSIQ